MEVKYQPIPQDDRQEVIEMGEDGHSSAYASPFTYNSIFSYDNSKMYKSPFTYGSMFAKQSNGLQMEKNTKASLTRSAVETVVILFCYGLLVMAFPLSLLFCLKFVSQFERLVVFRLGRLQDAKGPGTVMVLPCIDAYKRVDMRTKAFNVPPLQAITNDGGIIELGATVFYRIKDALASVLNVQDFNKALRNLAHSVMHRLVNKHPIQAIEKDRKLLRDELQAELNKAAFGWGMEIGNIDLSELRVIHQPEPRVNSALRTLMQPQVISSFIQAITGTEISPAQFHEAVDVPVSFNAASEAIMQLTNPADVFSALSGVNNDLAALVGFIQSALSDSLADEVDCSYQIECGGLGEFYMHLKKPQVFAGSGRLPEADVTITLERQELIDLLSEKLAPLDAYLSGKITITGDPRAALRMKPIAARLRPFLRANALCGNSSPSQGP